MVLNTEKHGWQELGGQDSLTSGYVVSTKITDNAQESLKD